MTTIYEKVAKVILGDIEVQCDYDEGSWDFSGYLTIDIDPFKKGEHVFITVDLNEGLVRVSGTDHRVVTRELTFDLGKIIYLKQ